MEKALVPVPFAGGIDTKTDPQQVIPGKLLDLQNGIFQKTGAVTRRWGYSSLSNAKIGASGNITAAKAITAFQNELLLYDGQNAYSYLTSEGAWATRGTLTSVIQKNTSIVRNTNQQLSPDHAQLNGIDVYAWEDSTGGVRYSIYDTISGSPIILNSLLLVTGKRPKILAGVSNIYILVQDTNLNTISMWSVSTTSLNITNIGPIIATVNTASAYDACLDPITTYIFVTASVFSSQGPLNLDIGTYAIAQTGTAIWAVIGVVGASLAGAAAIFGVYMSVQGVNSWTATIVAGQLVLGSVVYEPTNGVLTSADSSTTLTPSVSNVGSTCAVLAVNSGTNFFTNTFGTNVDTFFFVESILTTGVSIITVLALPLTGGPFNTGIPNATFIRGVGLAAKPFIQGGQIYVNVAYSSQQQCTYFTLDSNANVVAKALPGLGGGLLSQSDYMMPECQEVSTVLGGTVNGAPSGIFQYASLVKGSVNTEAGGVLSLLGVNLCQLDFTDSNHFASAAINGGLYTVGGVVQSYDGAQYVEHGFNVYPEGFTLTPSSTGGLLGQGLYYYCVTYEWVDNNGYRQISTPSIATAVTTSSATASVSLTIPTLRLTRKSNVQIVIYRTAVNGVSLTRVTSAALPTYSSTTVDTVTFVDTLSDASIAGNGAMYTQPLSTGGDPILPNGAPPACTLIATYANRLWLAGADDPYTLYYSQAVLLGVPAQFSSALTLRIDPDGGPITALARLDNNFFVFKRNGIFFITGQGPTATGDNNDLGTPVQVPSGGVGCVSSNSIALTPMGLLFQSANGIYLLDRSLNVTYKGAPVEKFNSLSVTSTTVLPNQWVIFFTQGITLLDGTPISGLAIVYDYYYDQWSLFTNHSAVDSDIFLGNGSLLVYANPNGTVYMQTPSIYSDAGQFIPFSLTTSWLNPNVLQGYQRVYHAFLLGQYYSTHTLTFQAGFDFDLSWPVNAVVPSDSALGIVTFGNDGNFGAGSPFGDKTNGASVYQFRFDLLHKCNAVRFQISDQQVAPGGLGFSLSAISLMVGIGKPERGNRMAIIKQFGVT